MKRMEYRVERLPLDEDQGTRILQLVERLNELGAQGWQVASVDLMPHPAFQSSPVPVLLEREVGEKAEPSGSTQANPAVGRIRSPRPERLRG
jgi:hypothetical protein